MASKDQPRALQGIPRNPGVHSIKDGSFGIARIDGKSGAWGRSKLTIFASNIVERCSPVLWTKEMRCKP